MTPRPDGRCPICGQAFDGSQSGLGAPRRYCGKSNCRRRGKAAERERQALARGREEASQDAADELAGLRRELAATVAELVELRRAVEDHDAEQRLIVAFGEFASATAMTLENGIRRMRDDLATAQRLHGSTTELVPVVELLAVVRRCVESLRGWPTS